MDKTATSKRVAVARPDAQRLVAVGHRLLKSVQDRPYNASVVEGAGVVRNELDRLVEVLEGPIVLALGVP
jgi:hypothetical protein